VYQHVAATSATKMRIAMIIRSILLHPLTSNFERHPTEMGEREASDFLSHLAVKRNVAASTQNQALSALLFLYRHVLKEPLDWLNDIERAKKQSRLPIVFTRA